ncbi:MAG: hypothetical protein ACRDQ4_24675 [Pseudonocardiaceae bacterium]
MAARSSAVYRWAGAALLRASTDPGGLDLPENLDLFGEDSAQQGLAWLSAVWQREEVRAALGWRARRCPGRLTTWWRSGTVMPERFAGS